MRRGSSPSLAIHLLNEGLLLEVKARLCYYVSVLLQRETEVYWILGREAARILNGYWILGREAARILDGYWILGREAARILDGYWILRREAARILADTEY